MSVALHRWVFVVALSVASVASVVVGSPAAAQERDIERAKERFGEGKQFYGDEEYAKAAEAFVDAYELSGRSELLYNIGQAYRLADDLENAEKYFQKYLEEKPEADNADEVVEIVIEIQRERAARMGTIRVETAEPGRDVHVGDEEEPRCQTPCESLALPPGTYEVSIRAKGFREYRKTVELAPSSTVEISAQLEMSVVPGRLIITTDRPGGRILIGREVDASLPLREPVTLNPGDYPVEIQTVRNVRWKGQVSVEPEETTQVMVPMQPLVDANKRGSVRKITAYSLWGVSLAMMAGGVLMGLQTNATFDELTEQQGRFGAVDADLHRQGKNQQLVANVMFGVGALSVASGIGLYVWDEYASGEEPQPSPRPTPDLEAEEPEKQQQPSESGESDSDVDLLE